MSKMSTTDGTGRTLVTADVVRAWARGKGYEVGTRGHLPEKLIREYNRTHRTFYQSGNPRVRQPELASV